MPAPRLELNDGRLGGDYVDLYLIHWPFPARHRYLETWRARIELRAEGRARSIGVSNFGIGELGRIAEATGELPAVNQIELHPRLARPALRPFHFEHRIVTEAWSPLGRGNALREQAIIRLAARRVRTPAQIVLRWHLQLGNVAIPKSVSPQRLEENARVFDFELDEEEMRELAALDTGERVGPDPASVEGPSGARGKLGELRERYPALEPLVAAARTALRRQ